MSERCLPSAQTAALPGPEARGAQGEPAPNRGLASHRTLERKHGVLVLLRSVSFWRLRASQCAAERSPDADGEGLALTIRAEKASFGG